MDLQHALREYVIGQHLKGQIPQDFDDDYDLIDAGIMDSLAIINTVFYLEQHYDTAIDEGDIVPKHFTSVNALLAFVLSKQRAQTT